MSARHPGPWTWEEHELSEGYSCIVYDARGERVGGCDHLDQETARLIAAAPDLCVALAELRANYCLLVTGQGVNPAVQPSVIRADAALAKAEGRP